MIRCIGQAIAAFLKSKSRLVAENLCLRQQLGAACDWEREPPRFLIHDRDSRFGAAFDRRVNGLGIASIRTPFRSPQANAIAERWVRSVRTECLDPMFILNERHLRRILAEYIAYFNHWRPHRSIGQRALCAPIALEPHPNGTKNIAEPVLGGLHHVYQLAARKRRIIFLRPTARVEPKNSAEAKT